MSRSPRRPWPCSTRSAGLPRGVGYRVSGDHSTWGEYHEGKHDFTGEIEEVLDRTDRPRAATHDRFSAALNRAADEVLDVAPDDDEHLRDAVNLVVNAGLHFVGHPDASLQEAVEANYDKDLPPSSWSPRNDRTPLNGQAPRA